MKKTLIDAGPLIALFDKDDKYHNKAFDFIGNHTDILVTTWPVITETLHMLDFNVNVQVDFLKWLEKGGLVIYTIEENDIARITDLTFKYSNIPMDLADATLITASENLNIKEIITIDSDFYIYKNIINDYIKNISI